MPRPSLLDALESIATAVTDTGALEATADPRLLQRPGALLSIVSVSSDRPGCRATVNARVTAVHPGPAGLDATAWLFDVACPAIAAVCGSLTFLPSEWDGMPAMTADLTLEVSPWQ